MPELRKDPILGRWVIISQERNGRPTSFKSETALPEAENTDNCPFCPGHEGQTPPELAAYYQPGRAPNSSGWWLRVVPNKYPALKSDGGIDKRGDGMYDCMNGVGAHEVIIETPNHFEMFDQMDDKRAEDVFWAFRERILELKKDERLQYALVFKNHGRAAGATIFHPHSQLIALPLVPIRVRQEISGAKSYYKYKERCVYCDMVSEERRDGRRVIMENDNFIAIAPYASRFPFETWILPKKHRGHFENSKPAEVSDMAKMFKSVFYRLRTALGNPSLNMMIHTTPMRESEKPYYHWHIEIMPKLTHVAGFEWGSGFYINSMSPESAAKTLAGVS